LPCVIKSVQVEGTNQFSAELGSMDLRHTIEHDTKKAYSRYIAGMNTERFPVCSKRT
jgi:hypothetical protein